MKLPPNGARANSFKAWQYLFIPAEEQMETQCLNPYLPLYKHIPDGEPHIFGDRLYVFGSHDRENGNEFCELDYVKM